MKQRLAQAWYDGSVWVKLLYPLSLLFGYVAVRRRDRLIAQGPYRAGVPVIVVGNITAGGTGKTPLCLALARHFTSLGQKVVFVSRGYGGSEAPRPLLVTPGTDTAQAGDEAVLLARQSQCPVIVDANRVNAVRYAESHCQPDLIISDDGLQHYALGRTVEIAVIDGTRGVGNGLLLPAGPLREPATRLQEVDFVVINGELQSSLPVAVTASYPMSLEATRVTNLLTGEQQSVDSWLKQYGRNPIHAVAGIGNPQRFFASLQQLGFVIMPHAFADHHAFRADDLAFGEYLPVLMTTKDAVKCRAFAQTHWWALEVEARVPPLLLENLRSCIQAGSKLA